MKLNELMFTDQKWLAKHKAHPKWQANFKLAQQRVAKRIKNIPSITYPTELPVSEHRQKIKALIENNQVVIISGETGSGKTTQLPKICLELGLAKQGLIGHTQPRRLAAQTIAQRIALELNCPLGKQVGYQVRFTDKTDEASLLKLMTDGILLSEIKYDPLLLKYQTIIIDEAHERSLNIDFLLGYLKRILVKRPDLKIIITSATIEVELFSKHFNHAPTYHVSGRNFPIETFYLDETTANDKDLVNLVCQTIADIEQLERKTPNSALMSNILVFLACERDIKDVSYQLLKQGYAKDEIYPLYARLAKSEQAKVFAQNSKKRKIILSTNIAETSLTVPGVRYVIDSGLVRISRFNYRSKVQQLPIEYISKASANQRQGRCGRQGAGVCFRLYTEKSYQLMQDTTEPEILRTNLASVLLMSMDLNVGALEHFPFIQPPDNRYVKSAYNVLIELQALNSDKKITKIGKRLARISLDPRLAKMILSGEQLNCTIEVTIIAAFLSIQDPREVPPEKKEQAQQLHARFKNKKTPSDFYAILALWEYIEQQKLVLSKSALKKLCAKEFLNVLRLNEWQDLVYQLLNQLKKPYQEFSLKSTNIALIHQACLTALLSHIGKKDEGKNYHGARNRKFIVFPSSDLYKKPPLWLMASSLVETSKLYARMCAPFEPEWLSLYATHLITYQYHEAHWSKKHKQAMIYRSSILYGLIFKEKEKVFLSQIDKTLAREIFIREILVNQKLDDYFRTPPKFWQNNSQLIDEVKALESKSRRQDILIDNEGLYQCYDKRLPETIYDLESLKKYLKQAQATEQLSLNKEVLMQHSAHHITGQQFPDYIFNNALKLALTYHFDPSAIDDGVSVTVPLKYVSQLHDSYFSWLVPGLLQEKCVALLKTLPKKLRKCLSPIPETVHTIFCQEIYKEGHLYDFLCLKLKEIKKILIKPSDFNIEKLDPYYQINFKIYDEDKKLIIENRSLSNIKNKLQKILESKAKVISPHQSNTLNRYLSWQFDHISQAFNECNITVGSELFPGLFLDEDAVIFKVYADPLACSYHTKQALVFFLIAKSTKELNYLKKNLFKGKQAALTLAREPIGERLYDSFFENLLEQTFLSETLPKNKIQYDELYQKYQPNLLLNAQKYESAILQALALKQSLKAELALLSTHYIKNKEDLEQQLSRLFCTDYILYAKQHLLDYPRYLKAMLTRVKKMLRDPVKDLQLSKAINIYETKLWHYLNDNKQALLINIKLHHLRFFIEEMRISSFDQTIKTKEKVSLKRIAKLWSDIV